MAQIESQARRPLSKVEYVLARLREDIETGAVAAGSNLRQQELATRYGVSATPVREALRLLEADGTITYSQHRGVAVSELHPEEIYDLYRLRSAAEGSTVEAAVERLDPEQIERIVAAHDRLAATEGKGEATDLSRMNREFHFAIYESVSPIVSTFIAQLWTALPARLTIWQGESQARVLLAEHRAILDAIVRGDAAEAGRLMAAHVMTSEHFRQMQQGS
jgi:DNA-binding GntR family transcriptional regulator